MNRLMWYTKNNKETIMSNPNPQSGFKANPQNINKDGRPKKGYSITETFQEMFKAKPELKQELADSILKHAKRGDATAVKLIWNYMDGTPINNMDIKSGGEKLEFGWKTKEDQE